MAGQALMVAKKLVAYIKQARMRYPFIRNRDLYKDGEIMYMNGNDGTLFDWDMNQHTSEFMIFYDLPQCNMGFIKVHLDKYGVVYGWYYPLNNVYEGICLEPIQICTPEQAEIFVKTLYRSADLKDKFDVPVRQIKMGRDYKSFHSNRKH